MKLKTLSVKTFNSKILSLFQASRLDGPRWSGLLDHKTTDLLLSKTILTHVWKWISSQKKAFHILEYFVLENVIVYFTIALLCRLCTFTLVYIDTYIAHWHWHLYDVVLACIVFVDLEWPLWMMWNMLCSFWIWILFVF